MRNQQIEKYLASLEGKSPVTIQNYRVFLTAISEGTKKPLDKLTKADLFKFFDKPRKKRPQGFALNTREIYKVALRRFLMWLDKDHPLIEELHIIQKNLNKRVKTIDQKDILTEEDLARLIRAADNFRDQALIAVLFESGTRRSEFLGMKVGDIVFDDKGAALTVHGKTGPRRIRLINSVPYLQLWLQNHPQKDKSEAPLWTTKRDGKIKPMAKPSLPQVLTAIAKRAGITKRVNPHMYRHSRLTETAKFLSDGKQKIYAGWSASSRMAGIYTHLSGADLDDDLLKAAGRQVEEHHVNGVLKPKSCGRCGTENPGIAEYCVKCGLTLDPAKLMESQGEIEQLKEKMATLEKVMGTFIRLGEFQLDHKMSDQEVTEMLQRLKTAKIEEK